MEWIFGVKENLLIDIKSIYNEISLLYSRNKQLREDYSKVVIGNKIQPLQGPEFRHQEDNNLAKRKK